MQHLEEGTIHAWLDGALSSDEQAQVEQHVQQCAECASMVAEARGMIAGAARIVSALDVVPGGVIPKQRPAAPGSGSLWRSLRLTPLRAALAASLMIVGASLVAVRHEGARPFESLRADGALTAASASAPAPAAPALAPPPTAPPLVTDARARSVAKAEAPAVANAPQRFADSLAKSAPAARQALSDMVATDAAPKKADSSRVLPQMVAAAAPLPTAAPAAGAMNEFRRSAQNAQRDSAVTDAAKAKTAVVGELTAQRAGLGQARTLSMTSRESADVAGCYRVSPDSSAVPSLLPQRFALERSSTSAPARNSIYAIDAAGRLDTAVVGTWRNLSANLIAVNLVTGTTRQSLTLAQTVGGFAVQPATSFAPNGALRRIVRMDCPR